jgi:flagellar biosynthesis protein FlhF
MRMKKIIAPTMKEALARMKKELGEDAVLLSTRTARLDAQGAEVVEIIAALDEALQQATASMQGGNADMQPAMGRSTSEKAENPTHAAPKATSNAPASTAATPSTAPQNSRAASLSAAKRSQENLQNTEIQLTSALLGIKAELTEMREMIDILSDSIRYKHSASMGQLASYIYKRAIDADLQEDEALRVAGLTLAHGPYESNDAACMYARNLLAKDIQIAPPLQKKDRPTVIAFIGPTGCGKTTALARLAAICKLLMKAQVHILSADSFKVGGADQLQTIASIAGIPFQAAYSTQEVRQAVKQENPRRDFVFIDTVGRSPLNKQHRAELAAVLESAEPDITYLVLPATLSQPSFALALQAFSTLNPTALILTKLDETATLGPIITSLRSQPLPLAYFTDGQRIPEDIEPASAARLTGEIIPLYSSFFLNQDHTE